METPSSLQRFLTMDDLKTRWGINDETLKFWIRQGLPLYDTTTAKDPIPFCDDSVFAFDTYYIFDLDNRYRMAQAGYGVLLCRESDAVDFEVRHNLRPSSAISQPNQRSNTRKTLPGKDRQQIMDTAKRLWAQNDRLTLNEVAHLIKNGSPSDTGRAQMVRMTERQNLPPCTLSIKTIKDHIRPLNPHPEPGRRKKTLT